MKIHEKYIKRCVELAENALGNTYPNPLVGCVVVHEKRIIGEGWHQKSGEAHAEVNAINSVTDKHLLPKSTLYVSLEPCSHFGKTPPCSDFIIANGIKKVVIGTVDPFSEVSGRGIKKLLDAGCEVLVGVLEKECQELNIRFFTFHLKKRPYIILKWAETEDGFIAPDTRREERTPVWISNRYSKQLVHKWRAEENAILVGTNTAVNDNPRLDTRLWKGRNPVRVVLDRSLRIPKDSALLDESIKTIVICENLPLAKSKDLENSGDTESGITWETIDFKKEIAFQVCEILFKHQLQSVIIEGGRKTLQTFIDASLWDEARIFRGKGYFKTGVKAPVFSHKIIEEKNIDSDILKIFRND